MLDYVYSLNLNELLSYDDQDDDDLVPTELNSVFSELGAINVQGMFHCNGLLYFRLLGKSYLVNPATRESNKLPRAPRLQGEYGPFPNNLYGFGFDYSIDDYKVVNGQICWQNGDLVVQFSVCTLKAGSWRVIERQFPYSIPEYSQYPPRNFTGILLNGGLHWLMYKVGGDSLLSVCFLLEEEKVREIQLPVGCFYSIDNPLVELGVFRENKLFITTVRDNRGYSYGGIWVLMEYGVRESWTKATVVVPYCHSLRFCFWRKSHDLVVSDGDLLLYEL
ncbi:F-box/kelch-repeat protein At3g06240-like [Rosa rugosa]|uniref:F-box/kelch-repeat protein At3g06240-like n=1 Tax=Rosa rugosa TaxID=74645 RepID=UPI002B4184EA|nr:F-box/kelch-repeat protein At3g06240-like [Rosa rugosa]